jgi:hypothetical protein
MGHTTAATTLPAVKRSKRKHQDTVPLGMFIEEIEAVLSKINALER